MTVGDALKSAETALGAIGIGSARLDSELLMAHVLGRQRAWLLAHTDEVLGADQAAAYQILITKRAQHIPLVHLTGHRDFYGLDLTITPDVLTPRVETEQMVEWAVAEAPPGARLIDIGTGSGALAVAIAHARPDLVVTATEISPAALDIARANAKHHKLNINFVQSDLFEHVDGLFDVIVTNLPYLADDADLMPEVRREPAVALFGGPDGLGLYRRFLTQLPEHLAPGGWLFTECDPWQQADLTAAAEIIGLKLAHSGYFILGFRLA